MDTVARIPQFSESLVKQADKYEMDGICSPSNCAPSLPHDLWSRFPGAKWSDWYFKKLFQWRT